MPTTCSRLFIHGFVVAGFRIKQKIATFDFYLGRRFKINPLFGGYNARFDAATPE